MNQWTLGTRQLCWGGGLPSVTSSGWLLSPGSRSAAPAGKWWRQASHGVAVCRIPPPRWDLFFPPGNRKWTDWSWSRSGSGQVVAIPEFPHELALAVYALGPWSNTRSPMCSLTVYPLFPLILWHLHDFINICTNLFIFFWQNTRFSTFHMPVHPNRNTNKHMGKWAWEYTIQEGCVASWCPETTAFKGISHVWSMIRASKGFLAPPILLCILKQTGCSPPMSSSNQAVPPKWQQKGKLEGQSRRACSRPAIAKERSQTLESSFLFSGSSDRHLSLFRILNVLLIEDE